MIELLQILPMPIADITFLFNTFTKDRKPELKWLQYELKVQCSLTASKLNRLNNKMKKDSNDLQSWDCLHKTKPIMATYDKLLTLVQEKIASIEQPEWQKLSTEEKLALTLFEQEIKTIPEEELVNALFKTIRTKHLQLRQITIQCAAMKEQPGISAEEMKHLKIQQQQAVKTSYYLICQLRKIESQLLEYRIARIVTLPLSKRTESDQLKQELLSPIDANTLNTLRHKYITQHRDSSEQIASGLNNQSLIAEHTHRITQAKINLIEIKLTVITTNIINQLERTSPDFIKQNTNVIKPSPASVAANNHFSPELVTKNQPSPVSLALLPRRPKPALHFLSDTKSVNPTLFAFSNTNISTAHLLNSGNTSVNEAPQNTTNHIQRK